ncbi:MAG: DDE-type integrase/transposase/recombinase [Microcoleus sp. SIO2G3]|nr:DDE-type integrase/transposase/recombinase [Microcoleus sp. SIO2G3]
MARVSGIKLELPPSVQQRLEVIQSLIRAQGSDQYGAMQQQAAQTLGLSIRSVQRLMKAWREQGLVGVCPQPRSDRGTARISADWQKFIVKTYRAGNRSSRRMSPAQVAVRVKVRAQELGVSEYPSHMSVYRLLKPLIEKAQRPKRSIGWQGSRLVLTTRDGQDLTVEWSNQVWQVDHTPADVLVVDQTGALLGRPWLTIVVDTYSRCVMGMHLGFDAPSAAVVCLALRHAILPKSYSASYQLHQAWDAYGLPQHLYTDGGKDFRSTHLEQVTTALGIGLHRRRRPSDGGIVERPFGTFNTEFFSSLPGYTSSNVVDRSPTAEAEACLSLRQLEQLLVRYVVDNYNQTIDARMNNQTRIERWESGRIAQLSLLGDRDLDLCLMRRDRRSVYRNGYVQFANLVYQGELLGGYAGESVLIRYDPSDITTIWIYQQQGDREVFLVRAHAQGWETETLAYAEAQAISRRLRSAGKALSNQSMLNEVRDRDFAIEKAGRQHRQNRSAQSAAVPKPVPVKLPPPASIEAKAAIGPEAEQLPAAIDDPPVEDRPPKPVPSVPVYESYEQLQREARGW